MKTELTLIPMSVRLKTCLTRHGIVYIEELFEYTEDDYMMIRNIGRMNIEEVKGIVSLYKNRGGVSVD
jgi:DNA-directed RNA polymerase alpha subunit